MGRGGSDAARPTPREQVEQLDNERPQEAATPIGERQQVQGDPTYAAGGQAEGDERACRGEMRGQCAFSTFSLPLAVCPQAYARGKLVGFCIVQ